MPSKSGKEALSVLAWVVTLIVLAIPCIGVVVTIVWALTDRNESRQNFCRATIVLWLIGLVLYLVLVLCGFGPQIASSARQWLNQK